MVQTHVRKLLSVIFAITISSCSNDPDSPLIAAANASENCEFLVTGTSEPPSSGTPVVISDITGTVISANFFNSGAIDPPYFDGNESVSVCVSGPDANGNRTAEIITDVGLDNDFHIKGYPQFVIGTKFGNTFETSYQYYPNTGLPVEQQWPVTSSNLSSQNTPFEFANLEYVSAVKGVGLPAFTSNLPDISVTLNIDETNVIGAERDIMLESWFYDTSANADIIGNNIATGQPIANTLNNIVGVGHPHYDELDNTLLEMMVHIGALSPNDISGAKNNPGQNQLTEIFSGKDFDQDGIDDHFDVDSHNYIESPNPSDPKPGKYSSGIDNNNDGIDDADLLPVQIGEHLYSIWYGESFLSPIVIYSRETNTSLENDFDPNSPDMDLTSEGEITLPWNEFLEFTLSDLQLLLQDAGVSWAIGTSNVFTKMNSSGGAISGVEFGVEPQINNPTDLPYEVFINKFEVNIDGNLLGLIKEPDTTKPNTSITTPAGNSIPSGNYTFSGTATDIGGSGFDFVQVALRSRTLLEWYNFSDNSFSGVSGIGAVSASLSNTTGAHTEWSQSASLSDGEYTLVVKAFDNAGNSSSWSYKTFEVQGNDIFNPTIFIDTNETTISTAPYTFSGSATDAGGSGFSFVQFAIRSRTLSLWYNFSNNSFSGATGIGYIPANLSNTLTTFTDWSYTVGLPIGEYTLVVRSHDMAGNVSPWAYHKFRVVEPDISNPTVTIIDPSSDISAGTYIFTGNASDIGGSGFKYIKVAVFNRALLQWYNFTDSSFSDATGIGAVSAMLSNTTINSADWSQSISLPTGDYTLAVKSFDNADNKSPWVYRSFTAF